MTLPTALTLVFCLLGGTWAENGIKDGVTEQLKIPTRETGSMEDRGRLLHDLFKDYDKRSYPTNITARFSVSLLKFSVDEYVANVIEADIWMREVWTDPRLAFRPEDYGGILVVRVPRKDVWTPDLLLYNAESGPLGMQCVKTNVLILSDGRVLGGPPCTLRAYCGLTLDTEPYGEQTCTLKFGSWTLDGDAMDLQMYLADDGDLDYYTKNNHWEVSRFNATRVEKFYPCCKEPYITIDYELTFRRLRT